MLAINSNEIMNDINWITSEIIDMNLNATEIVPDETPHTNLVTSEHNPEPHDICKENPIKMSIHISSSGNYELQYDAQYAPVHTIDSASNNLPNILYEVNLYCSVCDHHYKSLVGLNRHLATRKHADQLAKQQYLLRNQHRNKQQYCSNYECYSNEMSPEFYHSIVNHLLEDEVNIHENDRRQKICRSTTNINENQSQLNLNSAYVQESSTFNSMQMSIDDKSCLDFSTIIRSKIDDDNLDFLTNFL